jgi:hypothetical protein
MKLRTIVLAVSLAVSGPALAHDHHDHEPTSDLSEEGLKGRAADELNRLIAVKKLDATWKGVPVKTIEKKGTEWLVTFENAKAKDNKVLYMFLKASGAFIAANFTGK